MSLKIVSLCLLVCAVALAVVTSLHPDRPRWELVALAAMLALAAIALLVVPQDGPPPDGGQAQSIALAQDRPEDGDAEDLGKPPLRRIG